MALALCMSVAAGFFVVVLFYPFVRAGIPFNGESHIVGRQFMKGKKNLLDKLQERLERAKIRFSAVQYIALSGITGGISYFLCSFVLHSWWLGLPALLVGILFSERFLRVKMANRSSRFEEGNVRALRIMAGALRANPSYLHAFEQVADSPFVGEVVRAEYRRAVELLRGGIPLETALQMLYRQTGSADVLHLASIVLIQRDLGGNLAKTVDSAASSILRRRQILRRQRAAMSQILAQVNLLSVMPFVFVISLLVNNPHHFDPLTADFEGRALMLGAFLAILTGGEIIRYVALRPLLGGGKEL
ncbi:type II secretion system F family protein [Brevibacillus sp. B_LB10_24]|uniref:type II secretion system F family protein n=1 Tax=Brevibacillus sp. B_LB10_24 TaxID=3380645 RepID=UPI0038BA206A